MNATLPEIQTLWRRRQAWHRAEKSLTLQSKAVCRGDKTIFRGSESKADLDRNKKEANALFDRIEAYYEADGEPTGTQSELTVGPLLAARKPLRESREAIEKVIEKHGKQLPVAPWIESVYGLGFLLAAAVCAESVGTDTEKGGVQIPGANHPGDYLTIAGLWSRFGVGLRDGQRQRKVAGKREDEKDTAEGELQGYAPKRRSLLWNVGNGLIGKMGKGPRLPVDLVLAAVEYAELSPYQKLFVDHMRKQAIAHPEFRLKDKLRKKDGVLVESFSKHCFNRSKRYVEKRILRDLWHQCRRAVGIPESQDYPAWVEKPHAIHHSSPMEGAHAD